MLSRSKRSQTDRNGVIPSVATKCLSNGAASNQKEDGETIIETQLTELFAHETLQEYHGSAQQDIFE